MYMLFPHGKILVVLRANPQLTTSFAEYASFYKIPVEHRDAAQLAQTIMVDALLEHAVWSHPESWAAARKERERTGLSLFWIGSGRIRQNVVRSTARGPRRGWKEIELTARVHREVARAYEQRKREGVPS